MAAGARKGRPNSGLAAAGGLTALSFAWFALLPHEGLFDELTILLALCAAAGSLLAAQWQGTIDVSASFVCVMLAAAYVGPAPAFAIAVFAEGVAWLHDRYRPSAFVINIAAIGLPALAAATLISELGDPDAARAPFLAILASAAILHLSLNFLLVSVLVALMDRLPVRGALRLPAQLVPALGLTVALTLAVAEVYERFGLGASTLVLLLIVAFTYMARLVVTARERTAQYASLSWGVLSGLVRTLDRRDGRAARHAAAVAAFARDIAAEAGMSRRDQELAHTAGLLHDIGTFALADRVLERDGALREADWDAIRRHPELGADLLRDLGVYGPVAEIVRAHHERIDGRGYPDGLTGDAIPAIARIVAVAEAYDTLTAEDTYRTKMTSFEALNELRRVAGRQLDSAYVEALARLLAGRGLDYRHADAADFDRELAIEERIASSIAPDAKGEEGVA
jgi:putative nucleotidyltransferase with HDIG domain